MRKGSISCEASERAGLPGGLKTFDLYT